MDSTYQIIFKLETRYLHLLSNPQMADNNYKLTLCPVNHHIYALIAGSTKNQYSTLHPLWKSVSMISTANVCPCHIAFVFGNSTPPNMCVHTLYFRLIDAGEGTWNSPQPYVSPDAQCESSYGVSDGFSAESHWQRFANYIFVIIDIRDGKRLQCFAEHKKNISINLSPFSPHCAQKVKQKHVELGTRTTNQDKAESIPERDSFRSRNQCDDRCTQNSTHNTTALNSFRLSLSCTFNLTKR